MIRRSISTGGILAAGEGSRLRRDGWESAKPLVSVAGVTLLEHVLGNFQAAGINRVAIIFNETEEDCARFARERFPELDLEIVIRTTASSYESYRTIAPGLGAGPALVSTVDAWCPRRDFLAFVEAASARPDQTVLAVTRFVEDERPLWVSLDSTGRVTRVGGKAGDAVTAGIYVFSERARGVAPPELPRLRDYLAWLAQSGEPVRAVEIPKVVDVDRAADVETAEDLVRRDGAPNPRPASRVPRLESSLCWGIYRELAHSPGRETDDAEILRATANALSRRGFRVELKSPDELPESDDTFGIPPFLFVMCEREAVVRRLAAWERRGVHVVNRPSAIRSTDRERAIPLFLSAEVPFPRSALVSTGVDDGSDFPLPCWIKRSDVHATQAGDVSFAEDRRQLEARLSDFCARGISRAVLQEHVPGDLIKFYGVREAAPERDSLFWFQWFYHRDQKLAGYAFEVTELQRAVARAAGALGLHVFGGDAIATPSGRIALIDLNAWPSFALYRQEAAEKIAALLAVRFGKETVVSRQ